MRIVGGRWRGRALEAPKGRGTTRPTTDRTRESVASMVLAARGLTMEGASVLDAFAGSGAMGLELLSRGAAQATFVDVSREAVACVRANVRRLGAAAGEARVVCGDVRTLARTGIAGAPFDVVILDPPYAMAADVVTALVVDLAQAGQLSDGALVVYERKASSAVLDVARIPGARQLRSKGHGSTACDLLLVRRESRMSDTASHVPAPGDATFASMYGDRMPVTHVVVPGTYDPPTYGHLDVIVRATRLFEQVSVAVAASAGKNGVGTTFTLNERVALLRGALADAGAAGVAVVPFSGLLVDLCASVGATGIVKGLRAMTDFEYELQQAELNRRLSPTIESVFVMSAPEYGYVSSSIVRELAALGGDVGFLVPPCVEAALRERFPQGGRSARRGASDGL